MLPKNHPFVINYENNKHELTGLGNNLRLAVETKGETIYETGISRGIRNRSARLYFFIPGVDRIGMKSLFTPEYTLENCYRGRLYRGVSGTRWLR